MAREVAHEDRSRLHARPPGRPADFLAEPTALPAGALLHVPPAVAGGAPAPLVVAFHGAGGSAAATLRLLREAADAARVILLAPQSRGRTWDVIEGGFGPDVECLDAALDLTFAGLPVDPARIVLAGFSDGASYALSLGLGNGDVVTHLIAFSPGFAAPEATRGRPRVFVSHGTGDRVLPVDRCSRRIVPRLTAAGYDVTYDEFDGGHEVPPATARRAFEWLGA